MREEDWENGEKRSRAYVQVHEMKIECAGLLIRIGWAE